MADIERKYADLIFRASRKYPSWDPEIPVRCGDYGRITLGRPAWMFWRRRMGVFVKEGNIYDDGKAKEWDIPEPSGEYGAHESEGLTWVTSQNGEEIDIHSAVSCQTPALMSCKVRAAFKFSSGSGAILVMVNDTITSIEPASRLRRLLDDKSMKGLVIVSQVHRCDSYARFLTTEASKFVAVGLSVDTPGGAAGGESEAKWVRSTNSGNFKTRVNKNGSRDFYPLFKLVSIVNGDLSSGLRGDGDTGDDVLPDAEPPWTEVTVQDSAVEQELSPESQGALPSHRPDSEPGVDAANNPSSARKYRFRIPFLS